jgi:hypothetical protein
VGSGQSAEHRGKGYDAERPAAALELVLVNLITQFEGFFLSELMSEYRSSSFFLMALLL